MRTMLRWLGHIMIIYSLGLIVSLALRYQIEVAKARKGS